MPAVAQFATAYESLRLRLAHSPLPGWVRQTADAWRSLLPARLRPLLRGEAGRLWLARAGEQLQVDLAQAGDEHALGTVPLDLPETREALAARLAQSSAPAWLALPPSAVLRRGLVLPLAAEARLRDVLAHEIDRQTPFAAEQVSFEGRVTGRDAAAGQLRVELLVLPLPRLQQELQALGPVAAHLAGADLRAPGETPLGVNLLPAGLRTRRADPGRRLNRMLLAVALVAGLLALGLVRLNRAEALSALQAEVAAAQVEVRQARLVRNQLVAKVDAANFLATRRAASPTMLELLDDLTRRVPDDTSVDKLSVIDGRLVMVGQSRAAPALVGLLQASPYLREPALTGAVQADPRTGRDRFTLAADVVGLAPEDDDDAGR